MVDTSHAGHPSDGEWRSFISSTITSISYYECGIHCYINPTACGYFVHDSVSGDCHIGMVLNGATILTPQVDSQTVQFWHTFDRNANPISSVYTSSDLGFGTSDVYNMFIYDSYNTGLDDNYKCSSFCLVAPGPCHLFVVVGTV